MAPLHVRATRYGPLSQYLFEIMQTHNDQHTHTPFEVTVGIMEPLLEQ